MGSTLAGIARFSRQLTAINSQVVNNQPLGRDIDEMLRIVDALQFHEQHGEVCPAGWSPGKAGMTPTAEGVAQYLSDNADSL